MGLVIISIADVGGGDEELEGVVLVHVQLSRLNQIKILSLIGLFFITRIQLTNWSRATLWIRIPFGRLMKNTVRQNWPTKKKKYNFVIFYGWSFSRSFEGSKEMYGTGIALFNTFSSIHI